MIRGRTARRGGFSLVELLVVIGIIGLLVALVASGVQVVRQTQMGKATEMTLTKLQQGLNGQWRAELDAIRSLEAYKNPPAALVTWAGDADRARSLVMLAEMRVRFPQTFAEATTPTRIESTANNKTVLLYEAQPLKVFSRAAGNSGAATDEAAALLFLTLTEKSVRGWSFPADDTTSSNQMDRAVGGRQFRVFKDAYGSPITYVRYVQNGEVDQFGPARTPFKDQFDTLDLNPKSPTANRGKLATWAGPNRTAAEGLLGPFGTANGSQFRMMSAVSAGPNREFEGLAAALADSDDVYGYRLARLDGKGD